MPQQPQQQDRTQPRNHLLFDPWTTNSTGHQHADDRTSSHGTARDTQIRTEKLTRQFASHSGPETGTVTEPDPTRKQKKILTGTTIYINGSTMPLISDHKLRRLLVEHGARLAVGLARGVSHVIIGRPNSPAAGSRTGSGSGSGGEAETRARGAGGGLAATKLQRQIDRCGSGSGRGVKVVGVEWLSLPSFSYMACWLIHSRAGCWRVSERKNDCRRLDLP